MYNEQSNCIRTKEKKRLLFADWNCRLNIYDLKKKEVV